MKYKQTITACALLMLSFSPSLVFSATAPNESSQIQWQVEKSWKLPNKPLDIVYSLDGKRVFILTDQEKVLAYTSDGELLGAIPVDKGVSAIDIAPRGEKLYLINQAENSFTDLSMSFVVNIDIAGSPFLGNENAPVTVAVFTDFECPHCSKAVSLLEQVLENNPDTVKIVLKNFPLNFHKFAKSSALAALAAGNQGKYWEFHDALFKTPKLNAATIDTIAAQLELDVKKLKEDMVSPQIQQKLAKDAFDAKEAGVRGTPTIFINGKLVKERTLPAIQKIIDEELTKNEKVSGESK